MEEEYQDLHNLTPSKLNELIEKQQQAFKPPKAVIKASLFVFIGTLFSLISQGKNYFSNSIATSYVTQINLPFISNCISFLLLFLFSSIYIKFSFQQISIKILALSLSFGILTIILAFGFGATIFEFSHLISTWVLIFFVIFFFVMERRNALTHSTLLFLGLAIGILANTLELLFTFFDVKKEIDTLRTTLTDSNIATNILALISSCLYCAFFYLSEKFLTKKEEVFNFLPFFSGICFVLNLVCVFISLEFKEIGTLFKSSESGTLILIVLGCSLAAAIIFGFYPFFIMRCGAFSLIVCLNFRLFWRYIYILIRGVDTYDDIKKYLPGHICSLVLFICALFIVCYTKLKIEVDNEESNIVDEVKNMPEGTNEDKGNLMDTGDNDSK
ncbi:MAG: hypothetical protein MJ252_06410 [archaeon]|nr:hypothetical protein [archaeon]